MKAYIAGPMRGYPSYNFPAFDAAAEFGRSLGIDIISPADIDRQSGFNEHEQVEITSEMSRTFCKRDIDAILTCDAIAMLPGWEHSRGARAEKAVAEWIQIPVLDATSFEMLDKTVLDEAKRLVYNDRAIDYGHPLDECGRIAGMWSILLGVEVKAEQIPMCMIAMKMSREMNRRKRDNAVDIAGYAECLDRIHSERVKRDTSHD